MNSKSSDLTKHITAGIPKKWEMSPAFITFLMNQTFYKIEQKMKQNYLLEFQVVI